MVLYGQVHRACCVDRDALIATLKNVNTSSFRKTLLQPMEVWTWQSFFSLWLYKDILQGTEVPWPWEEMMEAVSIYCSSTQPAGKRYHGTQVVLIFSSSRKYRSKYDLLRVWHYWIGWDSQGRILSEKQQGLKICTDSLWAFSCTEIAGIDLCTRQGALKGYSSSGQGDVSYPLKIEQVLLKGLPGLCLLTLVYNIRILFVPTAFVVLAAVSLPVSQTHPAEVCRKQRKTHCDAQKETLTKKSSRRHSPPVFRYFC